MSIQNKSQNDICIGDLVMASITDYSRKHFEDLFHNKEKPDWFPVKGTRGMVTKVTENQEKVCVKWEPGSTTYYPGNDEWWCPTSWVIKLENSQE